MGKSNTSSFNIRNKLNLITAILIVAGLIISACLILFFVRLFDSKNEMETPKIYNAKQIGATDTSVLLAWNSSEASKEFIVRYRDAGSMKTAEFRTDKSFAAIHGLEPYQQYSVTVIPKDKETEYESSTVFCSTAPYCHVTAVNVDEITCDSAHVTWSYEGIDEGFTLVFYALDQEGKRYVTSEKMTVAKGAASEYTVQGLLSELQYTVCVMPNTRYARVQKSTFLTGRYSKSYNRYYIIRFTPCSYDTTDSIHVNAVTNLTANQPYKTSMILSGSAEPTDKVNMEIYITDSEGHIVRHAVSNDTYLNPSGKNQYFYRSFVMEFNAPSVPGEYSIFAVIDGVTVKKNNFKVVRTN